MVKGRIVDARELIRQVGQREPLNPYQIAGMVSVIHSRGTGFPAGTVLDVRNPETVLMVLDRTAGEAAPHLIDCTWTDSRLTLFPRFSKNSLDELVYITPFEGRRQAVRENLIPVLYEIPNWLDLVRILSRYSLERDDESLAGHLDRVMEILLSYLFAASVQRFDPQARAEGEYALCRLIESFIASSDEEAFGHYTPFIESGLDFLTHILFLSNANSFERRVIESTGIKSALKKRFRYGIRAPHASGQALDCPAIVTALAQIKPCPKDMIGQLEEAAASDGIPADHPFRNKVLDRINLHTAEELEKRRQIYQQALEHGEDLAESVLSEGIAFIKSVGDRWKAILSSFQEMIETLSFRIQEAFSRILAVQILEVDKPEVKELLIEGLCQIVVRLEKNRKQASKELVYFFATLFLDHAYSSEETAEVVASFTALESLGCTLGRQNYFLMAQELIDHLIGRPLIRPLEVKYSVEDDDTGEPLVLAEDATASRAHVQHIKSLSAIIASNPRIMHRLIPYMIVQIEIGGVRLCDEDLIQYSISSLLRANCSVTHFLIRTFIKALPYSFKDIGPLDTLRLTAASLAKELANRGVKPIGNFLGKLRGDIHWLGSIENFYFSQGIVRYFATGKPEEIADWMPSESLPHLKMDKWCSPEEARGIADLCTRIFADLGISLSDKDSMMALVSLDTAPYRDDPTWPEFSRRMVLDVIELVKGLYTKYFIVREHAAGSTVNDDLEKMDQIIAERRRIKETLLTPDIHEPMPPAATLTEGTEDYVREMDRIKQDQPGTPIVLRAKKAGHAYAQKATYIEERFEAFNRDLRLEALQETLATSINNMHFEKISHENLPQALECLDLLIQGISVNGHSSYYLEQAGRDLRRAAALELTFDKVRDLLRIIKSELDDVHAFYRSRFEEPFDNFLAFCPMDKLPRKLKDLTTLKEIPDTDFFKNYLKTLYVSDLQARDGNLRVLETFLDKVELFLNQRLSESGRKVGWKDQTDRRPSPLYFPSQEEISPCRIGLKASLLRFAENTPPYFVITTDQSLRLRDELVQDADFRDDLSRAVAALGESWGRTLGDPARPALFSVRSGARVSMPGMMTTITNVGINDEIAEGLRATCGPLVCVRLLSALPAGIYASSVRGGKRRISGTDGRKQDSIASHA